MKNFQRWYLLGRTSVGFCDVDLHFVVVVVVVILHLLIFFIHIFFSTSSLTLSWTIARFLKLILNFQPSPEWFATLSFFNHSVIFLPWALRFWVGIFYPQTFFTLCSFPTFLARSRHFGTTCFYQDFTGSRQLISWKLQGFIMILQTRTRPICLFDLQ